MSNLIEQLKAKVAAGEIVRAWIEEVLFRGGPGEPGGWGIVSGAHFVVGVEYVDPITGQTLRRTLGPYPASMVPQDATADMPSLVGLVTAQQAATIDAQAAEIDALVTRVAELESAAAGRG